MASSQIKFWKKSYCDFEIASVSATASQGADYASFVLNRSNNSAWITTGSVDADNTTLTIDMGTPRTIDSIILLVHNFKAYTVKYYNGVTYVAFSTPIAETTNTQVSTFHTVTPTMTRYLQLQITGTMTVDDDKSLCQFIATEAIGQFAGWPVISSHNVSRLKNTGKMLSGKSNIQENVGFFSCNLSVECWTSDADLTLVEALYDSNEGFLVSLCGGVETQFKTIRKGYRLEDVFLMKPSNELSMDYLNGIYGTGVKVQVALTQVTT
jgi:hypothetical protein